MAHGCQQCAPCRKNRKRIWVHRMLLENLCHDYSIFVTLTYDDEHLPEDGSLNKKHILTWLNSFRKAVKREYKRKIRYYLVGEYGTQSNRPHYHAIIYGVNIAVADILHNTWGRGFTYIGDVNKDTTAYVAGYVLKGKKRMEELTSNGLTPEFARMSRNPGIGAFAVPKIVSALNGDKGQYAFKNGDVPNELAHGGIRAPLGRYLKTKIRQDLGRDIKCPNETLQMLKKEFQEEWKAVLSYSKTKKYKKGQFESSRDFAQRILVAKNQGRIDSAENKERLFSKKEKL